jgi:Tfp pilus assembly protein PilF
MIRHFRGVARLNCGQYPLARTDFDESLARQPDDVSVLQLRALVNAHLGDIECCAADCARAEQLAPEHPATHGAFGYLHLATEDFAQAANRFRRARGRSFGSTWHFEAGIAEVLAERPDAARREFEKGLRHASDRDIDDGLAELAEWSRKIPARQSAGERSQLLRNIRRRLLEVRTPRSWRVVPSRDTPPASRV